MDRSVPQALEVPVIGAAVVVQVPHRAAPGLHPPVLAIAAVLPPPALDPPSPDDVGDLVAAAAPDEGSGKAPVLLHPHFLVVPLGHLPNPLRESNACSSGKGTVLPRPRGCQAAVRGPPAWVHSRERWRARRTRSGRLRAGHSPLPRLGRSAPPPSSFRRG